ncbi:hypothetical protein BV20DRAFT_132092 [Pilatotrama ljubarskyi]|nr:hypothetical protein BV20DRAFT_132092 [Pilatotrama ljubarskyi]
MFRIPSITNLHHSGYPRLSLFSCCFLALVRHSYIPGRSSLAPCFFICIQGYLSLLPVTHSFLSPILPSPRLKALLVLTSRLLSPLSPSATSSSCSSSHLVHRAFLSPSSHPPLSCPLSHYPVPLRSRRLISFIPLLSFPSLSHPAHAISFRPPHHSFSPLALLFSPLPLPLPHMQPHSRLSISYLTLISLAPSNPCFLFPFPRQFLSSLPFRSSSPSRPLRVPTPCASHVYTLVPSPCLLSPVPFCLILFIHRTSLPISRS